MRLYITVLILTCLGCITLTTGCASLDGQAPRGTTASSLGNDALVYGRIRWIENGEERDSYKHSYGWNISPMYLRTEDMHEGQLGVESDGTFIWKLPRGRYIFHQIYWFDSWDGQHRFTPKVAFQIPEGANTFCLGTLVIDLIGKRDIIGGLRVKNIDIGIKDDCKLLANEFRLSYPDPDLQHARSLMIFNEQIPDRPEALENRDRTNDFLRAILPGLRTLY